MLEIRWMTTRDLDAVSEIELRSNDYYSTKQDFIELLRKRNVVAMVAEEDEGVVGFMIYELMNRRIHLLDICVRPENRRKGIGRHLIGKLTSKLSPKKRTRISVEVRERSLGIQLFLRAMNFKAVNVLRTYFEDSDEDAFVFHFLLAENPPKQV